MIADAPVLTEPVQTGPGKLLINPSQASTTCLLAAQAIPVKPDWPCDEAAQRGAANRPVDLNIWIMNIAVMSDRLQFGARSVLATGLHSAARFKL